MKEDILIELRKFFYKALLKNLKKIFMSKKIIKALALFGLFFSGFVGYAPGGYLSRLIYSR